MTPDAEIAEHLDGRKRTILRAVVTEYVARGEPVGSKRVVEVTALDVSSATVRNEMAALEELGLIQQPHTSAGRVPTDAGYRVFVDDLHDNAEAATTPRREVVQELLGSSRDVEDLLLRTSTVLSQLTRLVSLVIAPAIDSARLQLVELVSLSSQAALLLLVSDTGRVEKRYVDLAEPVVEADLDRIRTMLREHVQGHRMNDVHDRLEALTGEAPADLREPVGALADATSEELVSDIVRQVYVGGQASLAGDDAFEREQLSRVLELLEERETLARMLSDIPEADRPVVRIGAENEVEELQGASLVSQRYRLVTAGSLGVLGPTRMDYASVLSTVRAVAEQLQQTLSDLSE